MNEFIKEIVLFSEELNFDKCLMPFSVQSYETKKSIFSVSNNKIVENFETIYTVRCEGDIPFIGLFSTGNALDITLEKSEKITCSETITNLHYFLIHNIIALFSFLHINKFISLDYLKGKTYRNSELMPPPIVWNTNDEIIFKHIWDPLFPILQCVHNDDKFDTTLENKIYTYERYYRLVDKFKDICYRNNLQDIFNNYVMNSFEDWKKLYL